MIEHKEPRKDYFVFKVPRYPNDILLIQQGKSVIGQVTIKDKFEEELWQEAMKEINRLQREKQS